MKVLVAEVFKSRSFVHSGVFSYRPHFKDKSQTRYLHDSSCHPPYVHKSWPRRMCSRLQSLSSSKLLYNKVISEFQDRLAADFIVLQKHDLIARRRDRRQRDVGGTKCWVIIPFNPSYRGLSSTVRDVALKWSQHVHCKLPELSCAVSWSLSRRNISTFFRQNFDAGRGG